MYVCVFWKCPLLCLWKYACLRACVMRLSMYVFCTYVSEHVYIRMYLSIYIYKYNIYIYIHINIHIYIHTYIHTHTHTYIHTHTHTYTHVHTHRCNIALLRWQACNAHWPYTCANTHTHMLFKHTSIQIHTHTYSYTCFDKDNKCMHIHIYTHVYPPSRHCTPPVASV